MHELVLDDQSFSVPRRTLVNTWGVFMDNLVLLAKPYHVKCRVSIGSFRVFVDIVSGSDTTITEANTVDLALLCAEFKFRALSKVALDWQIAHPGSAPVMANRLLSALK
jgi:hypothetical protein